MEIMEFCQKVRNNLAIYAGEKVTVAVKQITKNNGIILHSIIVTERETNISPNIYLDELYEAYEKGETFRTIMDEVLQIYEDSRVKDNIDMGFFLNYDEMEKKVLYKVISYEKNKELLLQIPYIPIMDLALVFYCFVPRKELENATILIYNNHLQMWNITKERLYKDAINNTEGILPAKILSIEDMMKEIFLKELSTKELSTKELSAKGLEEDALSADELSAKESGAAAQRMGKDTQSNQERQGAEKSIGELPKTENQESDKRVQNQTAAQIAEQIIKSMTECRMNGKMFVLGNNIKLFGAAAMFYRGLLELAADRLQKNLFILPSSIHEVIIIPDDGEQEAEELWKMVCEINATQVEPEEVLTDSVYYFSRKKNKIEKLF